MAFTRTIMRLPFADTQCGFKAFRREAAQLVFGLQRIERWGFDPEILFIGIKRGLRIAEVPVTWGHDERSRISYLRDGMQMLLELVFVRWNALRGVYRRQPVEFIRESAVASGSRRSRGSLAGFRHLLRGVCDAYGIESPAAVTYQRQGFYPFGILSGRRIRMRSGEAPYRAHVGADRSLVRGVMRTVGLLPVRGSRFRCRHRRARSVPCGARPFASSRHGACYVEDVDPPLPEVMERLAALRIRAVVHHGGPLAGITANRVPHLDCWKIALHARGELRADCFKALRYYD